MRAATQQGADAEVPEERAEATERLAAADTTSASSQRRKRRGKCPPWSEEERQQLVQLVQLAISELGKKVPNSKVPMRTWQVVAQQLGTQRTEGAVEQQFYLMRRQARAAAGTAAAAAMSKRQLSDVKPTSGPLGDGAGTSLPPAQVDAAVAPPPSKRPRPQAVSDVGTTRPLQQQQSPPLPSTIRRAAALDDPSNTQGSGAGRKTGRRPRGRPPKGKHWSDTEGRYVDIKQAGQDQSPALVGSANRQQQPQARGATELEPSQNRSNHRAPPRRPERKVGKRPPGRPPKGKQWSDAEGRYVGITQQQAISKSDEELHRRPPKTGGDDPPSSSGAGAKHSTSAPAPTGGERIQQQQLEEKVRQLKRRYADLKGRSPRGRYCGRPEWLSRQIVALEHSQAIRNDAASAQAAAITKQLPSAHQLHKALSIGSEGAGVTCSMGSLDRHDGGSSELLKSGWVARWSQKYRSQFWWHAASQRSAWVHPETGLFPDGTRPAQQGPGSAVDGRAPRRHNTPARGDDGNDEACDGEPPARKVEKACTTSVPAAATDPSSSPQPQTQPTSALQVGVADGEGGCGSSSRSWVVGDSSSQVEVETAAAKKQLPSHPLEGMRWDVVRNEWTEEGWDGAGGCSVPAADHVIASTVPLDRRRALLLPPQGRAPEGTRWHPGRGAWVPLPGRNSCVPAASGSTSSSSSSSSVVRKVQMSWRGKPLGRPPRGKRWDPEANAWVSNS